MDLFRRFSNTGRGFVAENITWKLSPETLFKTAVSGKGKTVEFKIAPSAIGQGKITFSFKMPDGEIFEAEKIFDVGKPGPRFRF